MIPTALNNSNSVTQSVASATIGIASLILEGRALADDDFSIPLNGKKHVLLMPPGYSTTLHSCNNNSFGNLKSNSTNEYTLPSKSAANTNLNNKANNYEGSLMSNNVTCKPSTSSEASSSFTTRDLCSNAEIQHMQRIRQKLTQLRQSSPNPNCDPLSSVDQEIIVGGPSESHKNPHKVTELNADELSSGDELNSSYFNAPCQNNQRKISGSGSSLWNSSPTSTIGSASSINSTKILESNSEKNFSQYDYTKDSHSASNLLHDNSSLHSLQSLATNYLFSKTSNYFEKFPQNASCFSYNSSSKSFLNPGSSSQYVFNSSGINKFQNSEIINIQNSCTSSNLLKDLKNKKPLNPKQGPHCDQFLKRIGLNGNKVTQHDFEEHVCDMANLSEICFYWQIHCRQLEVMLSRSDSICIEVYLGPEEHEILLEQWVIEKEEKLNSSCITMQALCNAIRSQLYFSQITAWSELIKKYGPLDKEIVGNSRIKSCDYISLLGMNATTSSNIQNSNLPTYKKPRLNIFYRIKPYDSTATFNAKPNIHNFPNVQVSENCVLTVSLKSLPRLQGGIPKITESDLLLQNKSSPSTSNYGQDQSLLPAESELLGDNINAVCNEKGKHKCKHLEKVGRPFDAIEDSSGNSSSGGSAEKFDCTVSSNENISHRERQLNKYRRRIMKRDKRKKNLSNNFLAQDYENLGMDSYSIRVNQVKQKSQYLAENQDENKRNHFKLLDGKAQIDEIHLLQQQQELGSINSIGLPLYNTMSGSIAESVQTQQIEMVSVGTQTADFVMEHCCEKCGGEISLICLKCENKRPLAQLNTVASKFLKNKNSPERKLEKGELLLQAIQRVPKSKSQQQNTYENSNNRKFLSDEINSNLSKTSNDCQLCKKQKTQHNYKDQTLNTPCRKKIISKNDKNQFSNKCSNETNPPLLSQSKEDYIAPDISCNCSPSCLTLGINESNTLFLTPPLSIDTKFSNLEKSLFSPVEKHENTNLTPLLKISSDLKTESVISCKALPKINLTKIFCANEKNKISPVKSPVSSCAVVSMENKLLSSPSESIWIKSDINLDSNNALEIPLQTSNSAPAISNSASLSPRFIKQAAIYKRRSRHLSDRSDRSSLGSDDFSDEDIECIYPSPTASPLKSKYFTKLAAFARRPILGNLEESLFQKRFVPKKHVAGFKVLLGASGQFCPTQLTIPAASYFYELEGETLSTPYVCEIRLSRKGYTIPRFGTVQATLLNPLGTVVRMFVIPYDFRDMPPMNQTFIRQRILAVDSSTINRENKTNSKRNQNNIENNNTNNCLNSYNNFFNNTNCNNNKSSEIYSTEEHLPKEHLSSLRYSIHLRFQTSKSGRLALHTDIKFLISRRTDCDTAAAHAKGALESPNELRIITATPDRPKYSTRQEPQNFNKI